MTPGEVRQSTPRIAARPTLRPRLIVSSFCFAPDGTMEERNGWQRAMLATHKYDVTVLYCDVKGQKPEIDRRIASMSPPGNLVALDILGDIRTEKLLQRESTFYLGYRRWQRKAMEVAQALHRENPFALSHTATLCGYREPGFLMDLGIPHLWGPIGGTHNFDPAFKRLLDPPNQLRELSRSALNTYQLRYSRRVGNALRKSFVLSASEETRDHFLACRGVQTTVDLETGIDYPLPPPRSSREKSDRPIRILWSGRLRAWKGLPLLLHALKDIAGSVPFEMRVIGSGPCLAQWKQMACEFQIGSKIDWIPWDNYRDTLLHYSWADLFAFTSLRDTSGTGLVESLAAGTPIVGFNYQGAADLLRHDTGIPIATQSIQQARSDFGKAIERLNFDNELWNQFSVNGQKLASKLAWANRREEIETFYEQAIQQWQGHQRIQVAVPALPAKGMLSQPGMAGDPTIHRSV